MTPIVARLLGPGDAAAFREIRLETLRHYGPWFGRLHDVEASRPASYWARQMAGGADRGWTGVFAGTELVGVNAFRRYTGASNTALGWGNFVRPTFRKQGYGEALYKRRMEEIGARGYSNGLAVYLLHGNSRPREILLKQGARWMFDRRMSFAGGPPFLTHWYRVPLVSPALPPC